MQRAGVGRLGGPGRGSDGTPFPRPQRVAKFGTFEILRLIFTEAMRAGGD
jgi:hypothetical protein